MRILIFALFVASLFSLSYPLLAQEQEEGDSTAYRRDQWFFRQRGAPNDYIPPTAMQDALAERDVMGPGNYYLTNSWTCSGPSPMFFWGNACSGRITTTRYMTNDQLLVGGANGGKSHAENL